MKQNRLSITYREIEMWIDNDEQLYNWAYAWVKSNKKNKATIKKFIEENRKDLEEYIAKKVI